MAFIVMIPSLFWTWFAFFYLKIFLFGKKTIKTIIFVGLDENTLIIKTAKWLRSPEREATLSLDKIQLVRSSRIYAGVGPCYYLLPTASASDDERFIFVPSFFKEGDRLLKILTKADAGIA